jgi:hypothetical protein
VSTGAPLKPSDTVMTKIFRIKGQNVTAPRVALLGISKSSAAEKEISSLPVHI